VEVESNNFRQDLYYRINVIELKVPSLRERLDDVPELAIELLNRISVDYKSKAPEIHGDAMEQLKSYHFPGNVRELTNILERAFLLCEDDIIRVEDLSLSPAEGGSIATTDLESYLEGIEKNVIVDALEATRWNKTAAAKKLGITFRALRYRLKKLGLE
jgi:two-component system response regulator PilR (NtrC family)